jgi:hypothetical protein
LTSSVTEPVDLRAARVRKSVHSQEHCPRQACAGQEPAAVAEAQQAFLNLNCPGTLSYVIGDDLGLRDGNWSFAIVADFATRTPTAPTTRTRSTTAPAPHSFR